MNPNDIIDAAPVRGQVWRVAPSPEGCVVPLVTVSVHAGFPSPAEDHAEAGLDLNRRLIRRPSATFVVRAEGDSMEPLIRTGDFLIVDRSLSPKDRDVVVAIIGGGFAVRRFWAAPRGAVPPFRLVSDNRASAGPPPASGEEVEIWGVVSAIIRELLKV